ncbi:MAG: hypothetical protein K8T20_07225 [Planctomycetes bacterium]|nr:hypothetical protein [Planctomycetota bacterium]
MPREGIDPVKTALVVVPRGWDIRAILRTGMLKPLREAGIKPVLLTPRATDPAFQKEFGDYDMEFYERHIPAGLEGTYRRTVNVLFSLKFPEHSLDFMARHFTDVEIAGHPFKQAYYGAVRVAGGVLPPLYGAVKKAERFIRADRRWGGIFRKWKPDAVITTPLFDWSDVPILKWAKKLGIPSASIVASWDNVSTKGAIAVRPDALTVWNEDMRHEAVETHGYRAERVAVTGVPPFDHWATGARMPREQFLAKYNLDPAKKVIMYMTAAARILPNEHEVVAHLIEASKGGAFGEFVPIFVRIHPRENRPEWQRLMNIPGVIIEKPPHSTGTDWDANLADLEHLRNTLNAGDVSMNVVSTVTVEACIADRPVFNIGYDGDRTPPEKDSARRHYKFTHYKRVPECGIPVAWSRQDMIDLVKGYLANPDKDRDARARVVKRLCGTVGGAAERAGKALAAFVLDGPDAISRHNPA